MNQHPDPQPPMTPSAHFPAPPVPASPMPPPPPAPSKPWYARWWSITAGIVLVLVCLGAVVGGDKSSDDDGDRTNASPSGDVGDGPGDTENADVEEPDFFTSEFPVFESVTESGSGDGVVELPAAKGLITATHSGSANFIITTMDESNEDTGLAVNTIGPYEGTTVFGIQDFRGEAASLQVVADGAWEITIAPISEAPELEGPQDGSGDAVHRYVGGADTWGIVHEGDANFIVTYVTAGFISSDLLVNEIGPYDGSVAVSAGPGLVIVNADGAWSITGS